MPKNQDPDSPGEQLLAAVSHPTSVGKLTGSYYLGTPEGDNESISDTDSSFTGSMNTGVSAVSGKDLMKLRKATMRIQHAESLATVFDARAEMKKMEHGPGSPEATKYQVKANEQRAKVRALRLQDQMHDLERNSMDAEPAHQTPHQASLFEKVEANKQSGLHHGNTIASGGHAPGVSSLSHFQVVSPSKVEFTSTPDSQSFMDLIGATTKDASQTGAQTTSGRSVSKSVATKVKPARGRSPAASSRSVLRSNASSRHSSVRSPSAKHRGAADGSDNKQVAELQGTLSQMMTQGQSVQRERDDLLQRNSVLLEHGRDLFAQHQNLIRENNDLTQSLQKSTDGAVRASEGRDQIVLEAEAVVSRLTEEQKELEKQLQEKSMEVARQDSTIRSEVTTQSEIVSRAEALLSEAQSQKDALRHELTNEFTMADLQAQKTRASKDAEIAQLRSELTISMAKMEACSANASSDLASVQMKLQTEFDQAKTQLQSEYQTTAQTFSNTTSEMQQKTLKMQQEYEESLREQKDSVSKLELLARAAASDKDRHRMQMDDNAIIVGELRRNNELLALQVKQQVDMFHEAKAEHVKDKEASLRQQGEFFREQHEELKRTIQEESKKEPDLPRFDQLYPNMYRSDDHKLPPPSHPTVPMDHFPADEVRNRFNGADPGQRLRGGDDPRLRQSGPPSMNVQATVPTFGGPTAGPNGHPENTPHVGTPTQAPTMPTYIAPSPSPQPHHGLNAHTPEWGIIKNHSHARAMSRADRNPMTMLGLPQEWNRNIDPFMVGPMVKEPMRMNDLHRQQADIFAQGHAHHPPYPGLTHQSAPAPAAPGAPGGNPGGVSIGASGQIHRERSAQRQQDDEWHSSGPPGAPSVPQYPVYPEDDGYNESEPGTERGRMLRAIHQQVQNLPKEKKLKEWDKIPIRELPTVRTKKQWLGRTCTTVALASGRTDDYNVVRWVMIATDTRFSWDDFIWSGQGYETLDFKLGQALAEFFTDDKGKTGEQGQRIFLLASKQIQESGMIPRGRQMINLMWHDLSSGIYVSTVFTWITLTEINLEGNKLMEFQLRWNAVLEEISVRPDDDSLRDLVLRQFRRCVIFKEDLRYFDNLPVAHPDKTYQWLMAILNKHVQRYKEETIAREYKETAGRPLLSLMGMPKTGQQVTLQTPSLRQGRGRSPRKGSRSPGGRSRPRTPRGKNFRSRSRTPGGTRKPRPRHSRSSSPAYSVGGTYKFSSSGNKRLPKYKDNQTCRFFTSGKPCPYGDACKYQHVSASAVKAAPAAPVPPTTQAQVSAPSKELTDRDFELMNTMYGEMDIRDAGNIYSDIDGDEVATAAAAKSFGKQKKKRFGKKFSQSAPCKYWPLGKCINGNKCPYFHGKKFSSFNKRKAAAATQENKEDHIEDPEGTSAAAKPKSRGRPRSRGRKE